MGIAGKLAATAAVTLTQIAMAGCQQNLNATMKSEGVELPKCKNGTLIPMWMPNENISAGDKAARAVVYFLTLGYLFLGVSIIADRFMASIEVITSKEREVLVKRPNGEVMKVTVKVWNETVSNLTLMALGSSAPEIMLSIIEVAGNNFHSGDLGPGTIVGSAAFNLFVIIGLCIYVIPSPDVRQVKHLRVFFVTASWSILAYVWMYLIIAQISPGKVEIWEGVLTFIMFPATVITAWIADRKLFPTFIAKRYHASRHKGVIVQSEGMTDIEMEADREMVGEDTDVLAFEQHRKEYIEIIRELRKKHPNMDMKSLEEMAEYEVLNRGPKSRAFYRIQATRKLTGGGNVIKKKLNAEHKKNPVVETDANPDLTEVIFEPAHYTVMENVGSMDVFVKRIGGNLSTTIYVDYTTVDGSANAGSDYEATSGTLVFGPGEVNKSFSVAIIDDDIFEEDEHFECKLTNLRIGEANGMYTSDSSAIKNFQLGTPSTATIMILDDDHAGIFHFEETEHEIVESIGQMHVKVQRSSGARGHVAIPYKTIDGTARSGRDFVASSGEVIFANDEHEKYIVINICDDEEYQKNVIFYLELGEPKLFRTAAETGPEESGIMVDPSATKDPNDMGEEERIAEMGKPRLGDIDKMRVIIKESTEFRNTVDKLLGQNNTGFVVGTSSWKEQFIEALSVSPGDDDDDDEDDDDVEKEETLPSCGDYVMHYLSLFWKLLFATVPPTDLVGGWACFVVSIIWVGVLTAVIGDIASSFGCTIGLLDSVTAISFVALGTSVPDTFASKVAAVGDQYADSSVGNVTGSNAVNVFLGIGIAWTLAAIVRKARGEDFDVEPGSLGFSVTLFVVLAIVAIILILLRRMKAVGGELGGPMKYKIPSALFMFTLWIIYVVVSALEAYKIIEGF